MFHIASIIKSNKAKSEGIIDSKFAQLIAGGDLTGSIAAPIEGNSSKKLKELNRRSKSTTGSNELTINLFDVTPNRIS